MIGRTAFVSTLLVGVMTIAGCASSNPSPGGSTATDAKSRDTLECGNLARQVRATPQGPRTTVNQDIYQQCMKERGHNTTQ